MAGAGNQQNYTEQGMKEHETTYVRFLSLLKTAIVATALVLLLLLIFVA